METANRAQVLQNKSLYISCVVPVFNEESVISSFVAALISLLESQTNQFEIILVDDGSRDRSLLIMQQLASDARIKVIGLSRNFGKEVALTAGLEHASGSVAIILDADFQHPLATIPVFLEHWSQGYDMVYGVRTDRESESYLKRRFANSFYWLMQKITQIDIPPNAGDFRLLDRQVINALNSFPERTRFMKGLYAWVGFKSLAVPFTVQQRAGGKSSWRFTRLTELAITGITSFSDVPLRVWGMIGFLISLVSLVYAIYIVTVTLLYGADLPGFPTLVVAIMFLGGVQLLSIGILGEYIARIFTEVKHRPKYLIHTKVGFDE